MTKGHDIGQGGKALVIALAMLGALSVAGPASQGQEPQAAPQRPAPKGAPDTSGVGRPEPPRMLREHPAAEPDPREEEIVTWLVRRADRYWHGGDYDGAVNCWRLVMILDPEWIEPYVVTWWLQWSMGKPKEAEETLQKGYLHNHNKWEMQWEFGLFYYTIKEYAKAIPYLQRAAKDPNAVPQVKRYIAHCYERLGDLQACFAVWQEIYKERPEDGVAALNFQRVQAKLKQSGK